MTSLFLNIIYQCIIYFYFLDLHFTSTSKTLIILGGARGVIVIVIGNEHDDTSSNPGRD